ncbi:hypothetical protein GLYMA_06G301102v4 [Glycine max]|nr:hypothetical protein GLYMA_06G301102v4 [Glycine max]KAH1128216.1 hypothetical protein GYH30_016682 [Glycine max]
MKTHSSTPKSTASPTTRRGSRTSASPNPLRLLLHAPPRPRQEPRPARSVHAPLGRQGPLLLPPLPRPPPPPRRRLQPLLRPLRLRWRRPGGRRAPPPRHRRRHRRRDPRVPAARPPRRSAQPPVLRRRVRPRLHRAVRRGAVCRRDGARDPAWRRVRCSRGGVWGG